MSSPPSPKKLIHVILVVWFIPKEGGYNSEVLSCCLNLNALNEERIWIDSDRCLMTVFDDGL